MVEQTKDAAERSAHVERGARRGKLAFQPPFVQLPGGAWKLRVLVEAEARIADLESENARLKKELSEARRINRWGVPV